MCRQLINGTHATDIVCQQLTFLGAGALGRLPSWPWEQGDHRQSGDHWLSAFRMTWKKNYRCLTPTPGDSDSADLGRLLMLWFSKSPKVIFMCSQA